MLDRQNNLILELLSKHEQLSASLQEVQSELRETKETVGRMVQENKATSNKDEVSIHCVPDVVGLWCVNHQYYDAIISVVIYISSQERLAKIHEASNKKFNPSLR